MTDVWGDQRATRRQLTLDLAGAVLFGLAMLAIHVSLGAGAAIATVLLAFGLGFRRVSWQVMSAFGFAGAVSQVLGSDIAYLANAAYAVFFTYCPVGTCRGQQGMSQLGNRLRVWVRVEET